MRLRIGAVDLPASGGPGRLGVFNVIDYAAPADGTRAANFGGSYTALVSFDGPSRAKVLLSYGRARSPVRRIRAINCHCYQPDTLRDAWRTRAQVEANLESRDRF